MSFTAGDVSGAITLTDSDHLYPDHINELRAMERPFMAIVGTTNESPFYCDGTDDDVEINAAMQLASTTGGKVFIRKGTYNLSQALAFNGLQNLTIEGEGIDATILKQAAGVQKFGIITSHQAAALTPGGGPDAAIYNLTIRNLTVDFNSTNNDYSALPAGHYMCAIDLNWCINALVEDVKIKDARIIGGLSDGLGTGIAFNGDVTGGLHAKANRVVFENCDFGITTSVITSPNDAYYTLTNLSFTSCRTGIYWEAGIGGVLQNIYVFAPTNNGISFGSVVANNVEVVLDNVNVFDGTGSLGIQAVGTRLKVRNCTAKGCTNVGIYMQGDQNVMEGCHAFENGTNGIVCSVITNSLIVACEAIDNSQTTPNASHGIEVDNATNVVVTGCRAFDTTVVVGNKHQYGGIVIPNDGSDYNTIVANNALGNRTANIAQSGANDIKQHNQE